MGADKFGFKREIKQTKESKKSAAINTAAMCCPF